MPAKKKLTPAQRKAEAERRMAKSHFDRNVAPGIEHERETFKRTIREQVEADDPIRKRALAKLDIRDAKQLAKFKASQPEAPPKSTSEDKADQEEKLGVKRKLNKVIVSVAEAARKKKKN